MKKRVLHLLASNSFSGAENVVCTIIENNKGYEMFYCSPAGPIEKILKTKKIKYIPIKRLSIIEIKRVCKQNKIDIIHAHDFKASFICSLVGFKGKIISHLHNNLPFIRSWNIYTILYSMACKKFYKIALVSDSIIKEAVFGKMISKKSVIINNVVDKKKIETMSKEVCDAKFDLIFIGRLVDEKNPVFFIELISELKKNNKNIKAAIIGDGVLKKVCQDKIKECDLSKNIFLYGFRSNPFCIIKNTLLVVMPSLYEGFGLTAIESMCLNKPVVNSGIGGLKTIFKEHKEFICNSKEEYISLCNRLIKNMDVRKQYINACQNIIKPYIDMESWMFKIYLLYK